MPSVSVIIPAFNQARFLAAAIESVLRQTHHDVELVIVDDGSTDDTPNLLAEYEGRSNVRVIRQQNAGVGAARNAGFVASRGALVTFLDADDYYHPERLARQVERFEKWSAIGFGYCDIIRVDVDGKVVDDYEVRTARIVLDGDIFESLLVGGYFPPHTVIVRREVFEGSGGFDPDLGGHADLDLWLRLSGSGVLADFLPEKLAYYRVHPASMSRDRAHMRQTRIRAIEKAVRAHPARAAAAMSSLQDLGEELHAANSWLQAALDDYVHFTGDGSPWMTYDFIEQLSSGGVTGAPDAAAVWDVSLDGAPARALLLHPPATLTFEVPDAGPGVITGAIALHPNVWDLTGPTAFEIVIDGYPALRRIVDPRQTSHRRWLHFQLDVPQSTTAHVISFSTEAVESRAHQWALWRSLRYLRTSEG
jgi:GT2 family glycosyltransferase